MDKICENGICREMTQEEITQMNAQAEEAEKEYWSSITYKQAIIDQIRLRYDNDDENALLRQRDTKPEEFEEYNTYCEQCKAYVKSKMGLEE